MQETDSILPAASRIPHLCLLGLVIPVFVLIALLFGFLFWFSLPVFYSGGNSIFSGEWQPEQGHFGIIPMIKGSMLLAVLTLCLSFPAAVGISGFCLLHPKHRITSLVHGMVRFMTGIPTVVYGLAALMLLVPLLRTWFTQSSGFGLLACLLALSLLTLPVMIMILENQLRESLNQHQLTGTSLGMSRSEILTHIIIPCAPQAFASAIVLGFGRAVGDTMLPLMLAGNAPQNPESLFDSIRTLTAHIGLVLSTEHGSATYNSLFASGFMLLAISVSLTVITRKLERSYQRRHPQASSSAQP
ncbi:ABC transporter permease subunit [Verrucomicrobiaceae bacterium N1E253]|uniref:ABC transporter permease subunit n=1 Tax=Oceaniferula marina TaxID=2748318 RepID=A0A851GSB8_9BACT|nr:ABC transporter permease subunit [Oceaniferula marina]NWK57134.1 ABC transporter permease subunit [Oceaniferula marina]